MTTFDSQVTRYYSQEEVQQILQLAIARQADDRDKEFSYQELMEIASELEISPESLKIAEREWQDRQGELQQRRAFDTYRQGRFKKRLGNYVIVNGFLVLLDLVTGGGLNFAQYILLFWGVGVGLDGWNVYQTKGEDYEMAFQKWNRNHQIKRTLNKVVNKFLNAVSK